MTAESIAMSPHVLFLLSVEELDDFSESESGSDFEETRKGKRWRKLSTAQPPVMHTVLYYRHLFLIYFLRLKLA